MVENRKENMHTDVGCKEWKCKISMSPHTSLYMQSFEQDNNFRKTKKNTDGTVALFSNNIR